MRSGDLPPSGLMTRWRLTAPVLMADTPRSRVWQVAQDDQKAVLKVLKPGGADEEPGMALMRWYEGRGAAQVLALGEGALLMERLEPRSLGDVARGGRDAAATVALCDVIGALHRDRPAPPPGLQPLALRFRPLIDSDPAGRVATMARELLASTTVEAALHGDLHHDNILHSPRGWLVIDPKGVRGDPAYEPSNAFRNPEGAEGLALQPGRIARLADAFAGRLELSARRVLGWAAAHAALSIIWHREAGTSVRFDEALLPRLLDAQANSAG